jgi:hypothetical protein
VKGGLGTVLALARAFVRCGEYSELPLRICRTCKATRLTQQILVCVAETVTAEAAVLPSFRLELACIALSAIDAAILSFGSIRAGTTWTAAIVIYDTIQASRQEGDEAVSRGPAWVCCSVAQSKAFLKCTLKESRSHSRGVL